MKPAEDAYILDTSWMGIEDVFEKQLQLLRKRLNKQNRVSICDKE